VEHPKLASIWDYWDEQAMIEIQDILWEYEYLFSNIFL
jgi:hypothetical protein